MTQLLFAGDYSEKKPLGAKGYLKLVPFGVQVATDGTLPSLLMKDESGEHSMPVMLNHLEAGVILAQFNKSVAPVTPHKAMVALLEQMKLRAEACRFVEIKGPMQWVELSLRGLARRQLLRLRAEDAMSFCLHTETPIYATATFMAHSRSLTTQGDKKVTGPIRMTPQMVGVDHPFVM